jgi:hypothetical protein
VAGSSGFSSSARQQARDILSNPPFRTTPSRTPRPLAGVLHALGRALNWAFGRPARWLYRHVLLHIGHGFKLAFGGWWVVVVGVLALALGVAVGVLIVRRRARISARETESASITTTTDDPDDIDGRAAAAESAGDHETAVRLRFRAGLVRLQRSGIIVNQSAQTGRQLSATLRSPTFDALAGRHELIVYARDPATPADSTTAREAWARVLVESRAGQHAEESHTSGVMTGST